MSKFCTEDCKPCPDPIHGRGKGDSRCEQNGMCRIERFGPFGPMVALQTFAGLAAQKRSSFRRKGAPTCPLRQKSRHTVCR